MRSAVDDLSPAAELYLWGYPLLTVQRTKAIQCSSEAGGSLTHRRNLATPAYKTVVAVNNDTLYSSGWFDVRHGDLEIVVPPMDHPGRYWNVMILDAYTHLSYIRRRDHGVDGTSVRVTFDPSTPPASGPARVLTHGTSLAWVIVRVLVESPDDLEAARSIQSRFEVRLAGAQPIERTERAGSPTAIHELGASFVADLTSAVKDQPPAPWHTAPSRAAWAILEDPSSAPAADLAVGVAEAHRQIRGMNVHDSISTNGWSTGRASTGSAKDLMKRAVGTMFGLGGHEAIENRSYIARTLTAGGALDGDRPMQLRFGPDDLPPCDGFWSLTAYGPDLHLVENEIDRFSIGDRTPGLIRDPDGGLTLQVAARRPADISNWLPVPSGPFLLGLRVYEGDPDVVSGQWFPPPLVSAD